MYDIRFARPFGVVGDTEVYCHLRKVVRADTVDVI